MGGVQTVAQDTGSASAQVLTIAEKFLEHSSDMNKQLTAFLGGDNNKDAAPSEDNG
jgi:hypothetical protein